MANVGAHKSVHLNLGEESRSGTEQKTESFAGLIKSSCTN